MSAPLATPSDIRISKMLDLSTHRALGVKLKVEGVPPGLKETAAVLNIQLEDESRSYRDHYVTLDFSGERTIIIPEPNTERMLQEFRPTQSNYYLKSAMRGFNYRKIVAVNIRWMRAPTGAVKCSLLNVEALAESNILVKKPIISLNAATVSLPVTLNTGDYVELFGSGPARVFDRNGALLSEVNVPVAPILKTGDNVLSIETAENGASIKLTILISGAPIAP